MPKSDPCQIITPLVLVGVRVRCGEGLGLGNQIVISTRGVIIWQGVENGHNTSTSYRQSRRLSRASGFKRGLHNHSIPYTPVHQSRQAANTSLIVHWI